MLAIMLLCVFCFVGSLIIAFLFALMKVAKRADDGTENIMRIMPRSVAKGG